jgi:hypothetical protein
LNRVEETRKALNVVSSPLQKAGYSIHQKIQECFSKLQASKEYQSMISEYEVLMIIITQKIPDCVLKIPLNERDKLIRNSISSFCSKLVDFFNQRKK